MRDDILPSEAPGNIFEHAPRMIAHVQGPLLPIAWALVMNHDGRPIYDYLRHIVFPNAYECHLVAWWIYNLAIN